MKRKLICELILLSVSFVAANKILDLGHTTDIILLKNSGNILVSQDRTGNWAIWDVPAKSQLLTGFLDPIGANNIDMANNTLVVNNSKSFDIYSLPGLSPKRIVVDSLDSVHVSANGKFIWTGNSANLKVWNNNGDQLLKLSGDFKQTAISCDSSKMFIQRPYADSLIVVSLPDFNSLPSVHFQGTFCSWLDDCNHFLTSQQGVARTYTSEGIRESIQEVSETIIGGYGRYFLTYKSGSYPDDDSVKIYSIGNNIPKKILLTYSSSRVVCGGNGYIGIILYGYDSITVCKLTQDTFETFKSRGSGPYITSFECNSQGQWFTGNRSGVINVATKDKAPEYLNYGKIRALSSSQNGMFVAATSSGRILIFQINNGIATLVDSIQHNSSALRLSSDGKILASQSNTTDAQYSPDYSSLILFNTANHTIIKKWNYALDDTSECLKDFDMSNDGTVISQKIGRFIGIDWIFRNTVSNIRQDSSYFSIEGDFGTAPKVSPDGELFAFCTGSLVKIYNKQQLVNAYSVSGMEDFGGWYNNYAIINNYENRGGSNKSWLGTDLYDTLGKTVSNLKFPEANNPTIISDTEIFTSNSNYGSIYNLNTGNKVFDLKDQFPSNLLNYTNIPVGNDIIIYQDNTALNLLFWRQNQSAIATNKKNSMPGDKIYLNKNQITAEFTLNQTQELKASLFSLNGAMIKSVSLGKLSHGYHKICIPMNDGFKKNFTVRNPMVVVLYAGHDILLSKKLIQIQ